MFGVFRWKLKQSAFWLRGFGQRLASLGDINRACVVPWDTMCFCTDLFVLIITNKCLSSPSHHNLSFVKMISGYYCYSEGQTEWLGRSSRKNRKGKTELMKSKCSAPDMNLSYTVQLCCSFCIYLKKHGIYKWQPTNLTPKPHGSSFPWSHARWRWQLLTFLLSCESGY